jgi:nucleotide-binding universal stress UspA family protein
MLTKILLPLDDSERSRRAVPYARMLARAAQAQLPLFQVVSDPSLRPYAEAALQTVACDLAPSDVRPVWDVVDGKPVEGIIQAAQTHQVDLICMATERWSDVDRWLNGSVMDAALRQARVPLLVVSPACSRARWEPNTHAARVLVSLDGSAFAEAILPAASNVAAALGADVCLLRVDADSVQAAEYLAAAAGRVVARSVETRVATRTLLGAEVPCAPHSPNRGGERDQRRGTQGSHAMPTPGPWLGG